MSKFRRPEQKQKQKQEQEQELWLWHGAGRRHRSRQSSAEQSSVLCPVGGGVGASWLELGFFLRAIGDLYDANIISINIRSKARDQR